MLTTRNDMGRGAPRAERSDRQPISSSTCNGRVCGNRRRCLPGSRERRWAAHLKSLVAAAVLAVPHLVLPTAPADAACEKSERIGHREAECVGEHLTVGVRDSHVTLDWLRIGPWRSLEEGELAGSTDIDRGQCRDWTWDSFAHVADDGRTRTGLQEMTGRDLLLGSSYLFTAGDSAPPGGRWLGWEQAAPIRFASAHGANGDGPIGLLGADCERGRLLAGVALSYGVGEGGFSAADRCGLGDSLSGVHPYVPPLRLQVTEEPYDVLASEVSGVEPGPLAPPLSCGEAQIQHHRIAIAANRGRLESLELLVLVF